MPQPTEHSILSQTLFPPSTLQAIVDLKTFKGLFPSGLREHPQVLILYRNLQHQRNLDLDHVKENIAEEVKLGETQKRELAKTRWRDAKGGKKRAFTGPNAQIEEREGDMEDMLYGARSETDSKAHDLATIVPALEAACTVVEAEIDEIHAESQRLIEQLKSTIGDMSDLRYGKLSRASLRKEVLDSLKAIDAECDEPQD